MSLSLSHSTTESLGPLQLGGCSLGPTEEGGGDIYGTINNMGCLPAVGGLEATTLLNTRTLLLSAYLPAFLLPLLCLYYRYISIYDFYSGGGYSLHHILFSMIIYISIYMGLILSEGFIFSATTSTTCSLLLLYCSAIYTAIFHLSGRTWDYTLKIPYSVLSALWTGIAI